MGKTITRLKISRQGTVTDSTSVSANAIFEKYVLEALKQWRFQPTDTEHILEVTVSFEFTQNECEGTSEHPVTSEIYVMADLPTYVRIKTGLPCLETSVSKNRH